jgi:hypothetical protein
MGTFVRRADPARGVAAVPDIAIEDAPWSFYWRDGQSEAAIDTERCPEAHAVSIGRRPSDTRRRQRNGA